MIKDLTFDRILILDGAMGTMLQKSGVSYTVGDNLNVEAPQVVEDVHSQYISAGADIIETNTFNNVSRETNLAGARIARKAADAAGRKVFVAGSMGPGSKMLGISTDADHPESRGATFDELAAGYYAQAQALVEGGADMLLIETVFDPVNAKSALYAVSKLQEDLGREVPVMLSATVNDRGGRLLTGQKLSAFYNAVEHFPLLSFGVNCSFGPHDLVQILETVAPQVTCAVSIHPNAGLPDGLGHYGETPESMAAELAAAARKGLVNIVGGCCGTTPDHIRAIKAALEGITPRAIPSAQSGKLVVSGLETVEIDLKSTNFVNVGERTNVAGSRKFAKLIAADSYEEATSVARKQIEDGASIIDINMDDPMLDSRSAMERFVRIIENDPAVARAALMIDSSDWETVLAGIKNAQGKSIVNSISLKEGEAEFIRKAVEINRLGAAMIVMAFDEDGQATSYERKIEICARAYRLLTGAGIAPQNIIFDVNILTIGTGIAEHDNYAVDFIRAVRWIKENLPCAHTSGGVSNLSFAFRGNNRVREAMHSVFLYHAIAAGLDMAIVNPGMLQIYSQIEPGLRKACEDVVLNSDPQATERLTALASEILQRQNGGEAVQTAADSWRAADVSERLQHALVQGISDYLREDLDEALAGSGPVKIIEGPLLQGMETVGKLFGEGQMFLPQVIKSAKVMRSAVDILQPLISSAETGQVSTKKKIVLATAQGDVHDIGKNILSVVLSCNGVEVIDLGVMVSNAEIMTAIGHHKPDYVGISGLITPSLAYMEDLCRKMDQSGLRIPLFVGGATTSALHTAVKLAPLYRGLICHSLSASDNANLINRYNRDAKLFEAEVRERQRRLVELHNAAPKKALTLQQAREKARRKTLPAPCVSSEFMDNDLSVRWLPISEIERFINWPMLLAFWGFKASEQQCAEATDCLEKARATLREMSRGGDVEVSAEVRFYDAASRDETILMGGDEFETARSLSGSCFSLADLVAPVGSDEPTRAGLFAVKVEDHHKCCDCKDYDHLMRAALCARLAEAAAEWITAGRAVIRPAFGYPACPDHNLKAKALRLLDPGSTLGITLTETCAMIPDTSVCGLLLNDPGNLSGMRG